MNLVAKEFVACKGYFYIYLVICYKMMLILYIAHVNTNNILISAIVNKENPGVLILSPFAGAGETMHEALRVNPYELGNAAQV